MFLLDLFKPKIIHVLFFIMSWLLIVVMQMQLRRDGETPQNEKRVVKRVKRDCVESLLRQTLDATCYSYILILSSYT